jgi:hypothetical protein
MDRSIKPGDVIVVGESFGHVTKIGVRAVSIVTRDGKEHLIPNENLMTQEVENCPIPAPTCASTFPVGVGYGCDLELAQKLMVEAGKTPARVLKSPSPTVWLRAFGESSVDHEILVWISDPRQAVGNVQSEILNRLWVLFKENGIDIPFAQRDIRVKEWPDCPSRDLQAEQLHQLVERLGQLVGQPPCSCPRTLLSRSQQRLYCSRRPAGRLHCKRVEAALNDRKRRLIGAAHQGSLIQAGSVSAPCASGRRRFPPQGTARAAAAPPAGPRRSRSNLIGVRLIGHPRQRSALR